LHGDTPSLVSPDLAIMAERRGRREIGPKKPRFWVTGAKSCGGAHAANAQDAIISVCESEVYAVESHPGSW